MFKLSTFILFILSAGYIFAQQPEVVEFYAVNYNNQTLCKIDTKGNIQEIGKINIKVGKYFGFDFNKVSGKFYAQIGLSNYEVDVTTGEFKNELKTYKTDGISNTGSVKIAINDQGESYVFIEQMAYTEGKLYRLDRNSGELVNLSNSNVGEASILGIEFDNEGELWTVVSCCNKSISTFDLSNGRLKNSIERSMNLGFPTDLDFINGEMYFLDIKNETSSNTTELYKVDLTSGQITLVTTFNTIIAGLSSGEQKVVTPPTEEPLEFYSIRNHDKMLCKISSDGTTEEIAIVSNKLPNIHKYLGIDYNKIDKNYYIANNSHMFRLNVTNGDIDTVTKLVRTDNFTNGITYFTSINSKGKFHVFIESNAGLEGKLYELENLESGNLIPLSNSTSGMASILGIEFDDEDNLWNVDECCRGSLNKFNLQNGVIDDHVNLDINVGYPTDLDYTNNSMYFLDIGNDNSSNTTKLMKTNVSTGQTEIVAIFNDTYQGLVGCLPFDYTPPTEDPLEFYAINYDNQTMCKVNTNGDIETIGNINVKVGKYFGFDYNKTNGKFYAQLGMSLYEVDVNSGEFKNELELFKTDGVSTAGSSKISINNQGEFYIFNEKIAGGQGKLYKLDDLNSGELIHLSDSNVGIASILGIEFDDEGNLWTVDECCNNGINKFNLENGKIESHVKLSTRVDFPTDLDFINNTMYFLDIRSEFNSNKTDLYKVDLKTGELTLITTYNAIIAGLSSGEPSEVIPPKTCDYELFDYSSLESEYNLESKGDLVVYQDFIRMTGEEQYQKSFLNYADYINLTNDFKTSFTFRVNDQDRYYDPSSKEDGFAFIIYNDSILDFELWKSTHFYEGIKNSLVIEIDLFQNFDYYKDPNDNHIAVVASKDFLIPDHETNDVLNVNPNIFKIERDNREYILHIDYNAERQRLKIDLENIDQRINVATLNNFTLSNYIDLKEDKFAKIGILSSTGRTYQIQEIADWKFCSTDYIEILEDTYEGGGVYPNPSSDYIYLTSFESIKDVKILDMFGSEQNDVTYDANLKRVDITKLQKGVYFVVIETDESTFTRKFIKY